MRIHQSRFFRRGLPSPIFISKERWHVKEPGDDLVARFSIQALIFERGHELVDLLIRLLDLQREFVSVGQDAA